MTRRMIRLLALTTLATLLSGPAFADELRDWRELGDRAAKRAAPSPAAELQARRLVRTAIAGALIRAEPLHDRAGSDFAAAVAAFQVLTTLFPADRALFEDRLRRSSALVSDDSLLDDSAKEGRRAAQAALLVDWPSRLAPGMGDAGGGSLIQEPAKAPRRTEPDLLRIPPTTTTPTSRDSATSFAL